MDRDHPGCRVLSDRRALPTANSSTPWSAARTKGSWSRTAGTATAISTPTRRQVCWSHLQRDFRRHADGLGEQKTFGEKGVPLTKKVFAAWRAYQHEHHDRALLQAEIAPVQAELRALLHQASPKNARNRWHRQFANNLLKIWPALWTFAMIDGIGADQQSRRARAPRPGHPPKSRARHAEQQRRAVR